MEWERIVFKARLIKEEFLKSYKCLNINRDTKDETVNKHVKNLVERLEQIRALLNDIYPRLTTAHKSAAESFFTDTRDKLISVTQKRGIKLEIPTSLTEPITFTPPVDIDTDINIKPKPPVDTKININPNPAVDINNIINMPQTNVEFLNTASKLLPDFDGKPENLQSFIDALTLVESIKDTHESLAINLVKTKLKGTSRNLITTETTLSEIISKLRSTVKGESVDVITAKLMNIRQSGKNANSYVNEVDDLAKKLETAYISDGLPNETASKYATRSAVTAIIKNASNERVKLIMESGTFSSMNDVKTKFISSCTDVIGQPNSVLAFVPNQRRNYNNNSGHNYRNYRPNHNRHYDNNANSFNRNNGNPNPNYDRNSYSSRNRNSNGRNNYNNRKSNYNQNNNGRTANVRCINNNESEN